MCEVNRFMKTNFNNYTKSDYYEMLSNFLKIVAEQKENVDMIYINQFAIYNKFFDFYENSIGYALLYNDSDKKRLSAVDFRPADNKSKASRESVEVFINEVLYNKEIEFFGRACLREMGESEAESLLSIPIRTGEIISGYVIVFTYETQNIRACIDEASLAFLSRISDITGWALQHNYLKSRISYVTLNDTLTGLPNKSYFYQIVINAIESAYYEGTKFILLVISINGLSDINTYLGISTGDTVISEVSSRLKKVAEVYSCIPGRINGDNFGLIAPITEISKEVAVFYCQKIIEKTRKPIYTDDEELTIGINVGASIYPLDGENVESLIKNADAANAAAGLLGKNEFKIYNEKMTEESERVLFLSNNLPIAISHDQFELYYQCQVNIETEKVIGVEALIRWIHPSRGIIYPMEFIPFAEDNHYSLQIDTIVIDMACKQYRRWHSKGINIKVSVNISAKHFTNGAILNTLKKIFKNNDITDPSFMCIELIENAILGDFEQTVEVMNKIKDMNVTIALDDFGAGYSSFEYLTMLPLNVLKIDRALCMDMMTKSNNKLILKTITNLAHEIGFKVLAEGVEETGHFEYLREIGCDYAQGYLINKPVPAEEAEKLVMKYNGENF